MSTPKTDASIVLASQSYNRQRLLALTGLEFTILPSEFDEYAVKLDAFSSREEYVETIAVGKVLQVADTLESTARNTTEQMPDVIVGGDLVVFLENTPYHKPTSLNEAREFTQQLVGQTHEEICATVTWTRENGLQVGTETIAIEVPELSDEEIETYLEIATPLTKAGGFSLTAVQNILRRRTDTTHCTVHGSLSGVLGLSLPLLETFLQSSSHPLPRSAESIEAELEKDLFSKQE